MKVRELLSSAVSFGRMIVHPEELSEVLRFIDGLATQPFLMDPVLATWRATEEGARALRERPRLGAIDLAALEALPEGTLGHTYARHMRQNNLDPGALPTREAGSDAEYVHAHMYETHDIWHVVTGFAADKPGELGLNAVYLAQMPGRASLGLITMGCAHTLLRDFDDYPPRATAITRGWLLGRRARPLFGVDWKALWSEPVPAVRRRFEVDADGVDRVLATWSSAHVPPNA